MAGKLIYHDIATPDICQKHSDILFVFGDNLQGYGKAGQACIRDEPNAFGIPTKRAPGRNPSDYFTNAGAFPGSPVRKRINTAFMTLLAALRGGATVSFPRAGIGTGLAQLQQRAPAVAAFIDEWIQRLEKEAGPQPIIMVTPC